jgi:hypothetical protein
VSLNTACSSISSDSVGPGATAARAPASRRVAGGIPQEVVDAVRRVRELDGPVPQGHDYQECRAVVRRAFDLKPWQMHPLDIDGDDPPAWLAPRREDVGWDRARELRAMLDEATAVP